MCPAKIGIWMAILNLYILLAVIGKEVFNRNVTGVVFSPYILAESANKSRLYSSFAFKDVWTMLEVISTRFTRVLVHIFEDFDGPYLPGATYYNSMLVSVRTAEIAAQINKQRNRLSLTVMIGIYDSNWLNNQQMSVNFQVALEAAHIAHAIFPGTVEGIFLECDEVESLFNVSNEMIALLQKTSMSPWLRIGIAFDGSDYLSYSFSDKSAEETELEEATDKFEPEQTTEDFDFDFVICSYLPNENITTKEFLEDTEMITSSFEQLRSVFVFINFTGEFMLVTAVPKPKQNETINDVENLHQTWFYLNNFANERNLTVWIDGAFDNALVNSMAWWKLVGYEFMHNVSGYIEKPSAWLGRPKLQMPIGDPQIGYNKFAYAGLISAVIGTGLLTGLVIYVYKKAISSRFMILPSREVQEFLVGCSSNFSITENINEFTLNLSAFKKPYDRRLEIPRESLKILTNDVLGAGEFGVVFKAILRNKYAELEVALKMAKPNSGSHALRGLLSEIKILSYLGEHPNIVSIAGAYTAEIEKGIVYVATKFCPIGSLKNVLRSYQDTTRSAIPYIEMASWSYEIACGMEYLEQKGVIHADLATRNVLLSADRVAKITDFGLAKRLYEYSNYTRSQQKPLPWRWMALESLKHLEFSSKSDVWSYGVTLWEIYSLGAQPYPGMNWSPGFIDSLHDGFRLNKPEHASPEIFDTMLNCWLMKKELRPSFKDLMILTEAVLGSDIEDSNTK